MYLVHPIHNLKRSRDIDIESFLLAGTDIVVPGPNMNAVLTAVRVNTKDRDPGSYILRIQVDST